MSGKDIDVDDVNSTLKALDGKEWPVDVIKEIYIKNDYTIASMARDLRLPKAKLKKMALAGEVSWDKLKKEYRENWILSLSERFDDTLLQKQTIVQRIEELTLMELSLRIKEIEDHFAQYGDFFSRDVEGEIMKDGKGQAIRLRLPNNVQDLNTLKGLEEAKISNAKLLRERLSGLEQEANKQTKDVIDVEAYNLFGENE